MPNLFFFISPRCYSLFSLIRGVIKSYLQPKEDTFLPYLASLHLLLFCYASAYWSVQPLLAFMALEMGLDAVGFGTFQSFFHLNQLLGGFFVGYVQDTRSIASALALAAFSLSSSLLFLSCSTNIYLFFISRIPCAFMHMVQVSQAAIPTFVAPEHQSQALGRVFVTYGIGMLFGSVTGGAGAQKFTPRGVSFTSGILLSCVSFIVYRYMLSTVLTDLCVASSEGRTKAENVDKKTYDNVNEQKLDKVIEDDDHNNFNRCHEIKFTCDTIKEITISNGYESNLDFEKSEYKAVDTSLHHSNHAISTREDDDGDDSIIINYSESSFEKEPQRNERVANAQNIMHSHTENAKEECSTKVSLPLVGSKAETSSVENENTGQICNREHDASRSNRGLIENLAHAIKQPYMKYMVPFCLLLQASRSIQESIFPLVLARDYKLSPSTVAILTAYVGGVGVIINTFCVDMIQRKLGLPVLTLTSACCYAVSLIFVPFSWNVTTLVVFLFPLVLFATFAYTTLASSAVRISEKNTMGTSICLTHTTNSLMSLIGPTLSGFVLQFSGFFGVCFVSSALAFSASCIFVIFLFTPLKK